jgi:hypothetical protein
MSRRSLPLLGILLAAFGVAAGVGYLLLHREPVYGGRPRSYWKEHLGIALYTMESPSGRLQELVWKANPWKKRTFAGMMPLETCEASLELLGEMLSDSDPELRLLALFAISVHYGPSPESWQLYLRATFDPDVNVRSDAFLHVCGFSGQWTAAIVEDYLGLLTSGDPSVWELAPPGEHIPPYLEAREGISTALQQRAKARTLNAEEVRLLQELQQAGPAARLGPSP